MDANGAWVWLKNIGFDTHKMKTHHRSQGISTKTLSHHISKHIGIQMERMHITSFSDGNSSQLDADVPKDVMDKETRTKQQKQGSNEQGNIIESQLSCFTSLTDLFLNDLQPHHQFTKGDTRSINDVTWSVFPLVIGGEGHV